MTAKVELTGADKLMQKFGRMSTYQYKFRNAVEAVLREMANWVKEHHETDGGWKNDTFALHNSIDIVKPEFVGSGAGSKIVGYVKAGQYYAPYVENRPGHWVLSRVEQVFKPLLMKKIAEYMAAQGAV